MALNQAFSRRIRQQTTRLVAVQKRHLADTVMATTKVRIGSAEVQAGARKKGDHWANDHGTSFKNPWSSFKMPGGWALAKFAYSLATKKDQTLKLAKSLIPHVVPSWGVDLPRKDLKATWLGHACALVEMPVTAGTEVKRGVRVLFDPALGSGMAPMSLGPKRESLIPCAIEDLPQIDIIAISHNHYDHLDLPTLTSIFKSQSSQYASSPALFLPLNNRHIVSDLPMDKEKIVELDWWEGREVDVEGVGKVKMVCTPCQHSTGRTPLDRDQSLWSSWVIQDKSASDAKKAASVWFGGDTGYCTMHSDIHEGTHPTVTHPEAAPQDVCPAFKEIGERLGPFNLGLIPIGAYSPRTVMSPLHAAPVDSVKMFSDTKCQQAIGIHWGSFRMTDERFTEPPERLEAAVKEAGMESGLFNVLKIGETRGYHVS